jgi:hypothetical protein
LQAAAAALGAALAARDASGTQAALDAVEAELLYLDASASFLLQSAAHGAWGPSSDRSAHPLFKFSERKLDHCRTL